MTATTTITLTDFLLARYKEREAELQNEYFATGRVGHSDNCCYEGGFEGTHRCDCGAVEFALADTEAKRKIIAVAYELAQDIDSEYGDCCLEDQVRAGGSGGSSCYVQKTLRQILTPLAQPYSSHPSFNPEWRLPHQQ